MSRKTTETTKAQDRPTKSAAQSQLTRIKREEEEELWISGEELYTEGSSDEEDPRTQSRSRRKVNGNRSRNASSASKHRGRSSEKESSSKTPNDALESKIEKENKNGKLSSPDDTSNLSNASSLNTSRSSSMDSRSTHESHATIITDSNEPLNDEKNSSVDLLSSEDNSPTNEEISWKARRENSLSFDEVETALKELQENYCQVSFSISRLQNVANTDDPNYETDERKSHRILERETNYEDEFDSSIFTSGKFTKNLEEERNTDNDIHNIQNLDTAIKELSIKLQEASKETLSCQYNNRKTLKKILSSSSIETGRLAENTRQFFQLCPQYSDFINDDADNAVEDRKNILNESLSEQKKSGNGKRLRNPDKKDMKLIKKMADHRISDRTLRKYSQYVDEKMLNVTRDLFEKDNDINSDINPYSVNEQTRGLINELDKKLVILRRDTNLKIRSIMDLDISKNDVSLLRSYTTEINTNNTNILSVSSVPTISTLENISENIMEEMFNERNPTNTSS